MGGFDFTPVLIAAVLLFVVLGTLDFFGSLPAGERGLLMYERTCPIYSSLAPGARPHNPATR